MYPANGICEFKATSEKNHNLIVYRFTIGELFNTNVHSNNTSHPPLVNSR
jgi:hypothetical protein